jgi:hypothetical protein
MGLSQEMILYDVSDELSSVMHMVKMMLNR